MIRRLRFKFVAICMVLVSVVLAAVFSLVYLSAARNMESLSRQVLSRVLREETSRFSRPDASVNIGGERVLLPYFTVNVWGDTVYVTGGTYSNLEDTDTLRAILTDCLSQEGQEGTIAGYQMRYLRQDNGLYQKIAFVDMSMELALLRQLMGACLLIALAALFVLLGVAAALSRWATAPVERAWRQQRQFLSDASHELKTPLTVILSNAELLEAAPLAEKPARWADNIHSEARRMRSLVEQMLTLARADNAVQTAVMSQVSLSAAAEDCVLAFEPVAFEAGKRLESRIAEDVEVLGDGDRLRQVVSVLLDNAIKYGAPPDPITLTLQKTERQARLTVSNPGAPIPPEQLKRLFERFYRADDSRGEQSGFGLGLPIAAAIAAEHKGTLKAESDTASTRFIFTMPLLKK